ncbi:hypothetical protein D5S17_14315 [Pseudonocardiaceae bacterium YIM PH 21723]|nr:hypothetical protein D5S17_14315 [Pseudonocardiaceae bacterium YIM PH 21723]
MSTSSWVLLGIVVAAWLWAIIMCIPSIERWIVFPIVAKRNGWEYSGMDKKYVHGAHTLLRQVSGTYQRFTFEAFERTIKDRIDMPSKGRTSQIKLETGRKLPYMRFTYRRSGELVISPLSPNADAVLAAPVGNWLRAARPNFEFQVSGGTFSMDFEKRLTLGQLKKRLEFLAAVAERFPDIRPLA